MHVNPLFLLPDFALILFGAWLAHRVNFGADFWNGAEKLVYYVFFPLLLFRSINTAQFSLGAASLFAAAGLTGFIASIALSFLGRLFLKPPPKVFASVVQTGFRYNSYVSDWRWSPACSVRRGWRCSLCWSLYACRWPTCSPSMRWRANGKHTSAES